MALQTSISLAVFALRQVALNASGGAARESHGDKVGLEWPDGSGTSEAEEVWSEQNALTVGTQDVDLTAVSQLDDNGDTLRTAAFGAVKVVLVRNKNTPGGSGTLTVGGAAANPWDGAGTSFQVAGGKVDLPPGGVLLWAVPVGGAVSAGAKTLRLEATGATVTYEMVVIGDKA